MGISRSTVVRIIRQVKVIGCFTIVPLSAAAIRSYCQDYYAFNIRLAGTVDLLNTYRPNDHWLWTTARPAKENYQGLLERLAMNRRSEVSRLKDVQNLRSEPMECVTDEPMECVTDEPMECVTDELRFPDAGSGGTAEHTAVPPTIISGEAPSLEKETGEGASPEGNDWTAKPPTPDTEDDDADTAALLDLVASHACLQPSAGLYTHGRQSFYRWASDRLLRLLSQLSAADQEVILQCPVLIALALRRPQWDGLTLSWGLILSRYPDRLIGSIKEAVTEWRCRQQHSQPIPLPPPAPPAPPPAPKPPLGETAAEKTARDASFQARIAEIQAKLQLGNAQG